MTVRQDSSTGELQREAWFHVAAVMGSGETEALSQPVISCVADLKKARDVAELKEEARLQALARLGRDDFDLDELLRLTELEVQGGVAKDRSHPTYKAIFPKGLTAVAALRGEAEVREVEALCKRLTERLPDVAQRRAKELTALSQRCLASEKAWKDAEAAAHLAFGDELIARASLVRQLQKNRGALLSLFPGQPRRVASYYRPNDSHGPATVDAPPAK